MHWSVAEDMNRTTVRTSSLKTIYQSLLLCALKVLLKRMGHGSMPHRTTIHDSEVCHPHCVFKL